MGNVYVRAPSCLPMPLIAWIEQSLVGNFIKEVDRVFPKETGGVLMGYWARCYDEVVITAIIGPGDKAIHSEMSFCPDHEFQEREIEYFYKKSGRIHTYLGDWHSHPKAQTPDLSNKDKRTLRNISNFKQARLPVPLMGILWGEPSTWRLQLWRSPRRGSLLLGFRPQAMQIRFY